MEKIDRKLMSLLTIMTCLFRDLMLTSLLADILYGHCPHDRRLCIWKILMNGKMKYFQKCDFLQFFYTFVLEFGSLQEHLDFKLEGKLWDTKRPVDIPDSACLAYILFTSKTSK